eukprot:TRINITY_DN1033_c0_g1_i4.p1 TRINITY_DN1033_c0_g1~~TRINITY_DN1033_c0_g1_i4.p1  ORF type:complete len:1958 (+),score=678.41 TRINITY_DN1033_c0_g1_i4:71-5944(+)
MSGGKVMFPSLKREKSPSLPAVTLSVDSSTNNDNALADATSPTSSKRFSLTHLALASSSAVTSPPSSSPSSPQQGKRVPDSYFRETPEDELAQYPMDFEKYYESKEVSREPLKDLVIIPTDELEVVPVRREFRHADSTPKNYTRGTSLFLDDCMDTYRKDVYKVVRRKYHAKFSAATIRRQSNSNASTNSMPFELYQIDPLARSESVDEELAQPSPTMRGARPSISAERKDSASMERRESTVTDKRSSRPTLPMDISPQSSVDLEGEDELHLDYVDKKVASIIPSSPASCTLASPTSIVPRTTLFSLTPNSDSDPSPSSSSRDYPLPYSRKTGVQILVEVTKLEFRLSNQLDEAEPFYCSMFVYDQARRMRVSETFYFDFNSDKTEKMLGIHQGPKERETCSKRAIFQVTHPNQDLFLFLRVEKVLQGGDLEDVCEPYIRATLKTDKDKEKFMTQARQFCGRLGTFRQGFCWSMIPLFMEDKAGMQELSQGDGITFAPLYRHKTDMADAVMVDTALGDPGSVKTGGSSKKLKNIPGVCMVNIKDASGTLANRITPSYAAVAPSDGKGEVVREVEEFPRVARLVPHLDYVHLLYVYPETINFSNRSGSVNARNICIKVSLMANDDNVNQEGIKAIFGRSSCEALVTKAYTGVTYHSKTPNFYDEIKIALPVHILPSHHLLFTFYHIACQRADKDQIHDSPAVPLGYAVLPLLGPGGKFISEEENLPVAMECPPKYLSPQMENIMRYVENKKQLFQVRTRVVSSVYASSDRNMSRFLGSLEDEVVNPEEAQELLRYLSASKVESLVQFFHVLMGQLVRLMCMSESIEVTAATFVAMAETIGRVAEEGCMDVVGQYVQYMFDNLPTSPRPVYEVIVSTWLHVMRHFDSDAVLKIVRVPLWMIFKSMCLHLLTTEAKPGPIVANPNRKGRFSLWFHAELQRLVSVLVWEAKRTSGPFARELIRQLALFIVDLLPVMDRGYLFKLIERIVKDLDPAITSPGLNGSAGGGSNEGPDVLIELKFVFLKIIMVEYEFLVPLNLPLPDKIETIAKTFNSFSQHHFLSELLLGQAHDFLGHKEEGVRIEALTALRDVFSRVDQDPRYQDPRAKWRVTGLYLPLVSVAVQKWDVLSSRESFFERHLMLLEVLFVLKNMHPQLLRVFWREEPRNRLVTFFDLLATCVGVFEYSTVETLAERLSSAVVKRSTTKSVLESYYIGSLGRSSGKGAKSLRTQRAEMLAANAAAGGSGGFGRKAGSKRYNQSPMQVKVDPQFDYSDSMEMNLALEAGMIILDLVVDYIAEFEHQLRSTKPPNALLDKVFNVLCGMLRSNQPVVLLPPLYATLRAFVEKFGAAMFEYDTPYCAELCEEVLKHCNSPNRVTRSEAAAFVYVLMKRNYDHGRAGGSPRNFARVKVQATIGLSKIVARGIKDGVYLMRSLGSMRKYVAHDLKKAGKSSSTFSKEATDLLDRLQTVLDLGVRINKHKNDPEMVGDLYHQIAARHKATPDMRVAWLQGLQDFHLKNNAHPEAAQCSLHIAALIAEQLLLTQRASSSGGGGASAVAVFAQQGIPQGCMAFQDISPNIVEEGQLETEPGDANGKNVDTQLFSVSSLLREMLQAVNLLTACELYETSHLVYKLVLPIYEKRCDYAKLAEIHGDLRAVFTNIIQSTKSQSRMLGSYYRVGFYGRKFEELDGKEYVYKEPKITRLVEIKDRLIDLYGGEGAVTVLPDSGTVDRAKLDPALNFLQITSLTPYFEPDELALRPTEFHRKNNIARFVFYTPFTLHGDAQSASVGEQYKRKTVITTEKSFPYMRKRLFVSSRVETTLSPIENSIEGVEDRTAVLVQEVRADPPNPKTLQQVLQGSVRLQVNSGSQEICRAFLAPDWIGLNTPDHVARLRKALALFLRACEEAISLNKTLLESGANQAFHAELEAGYAQLRDYTLEFLGPFKPLASAQYEQGTDTIPTAS